MQHKYILQTHLEIRVISNTSILDIIQYNQNDLQRGLNTTSPKDTISSLQPCITNDLYDPRQWTIKTWKVRVQYLLGYCLVNILTHPNAYNYVIHIYRGFVPAGPHGFTPAGLIWPTLGTYNTRIHPRRVSRIYPRRVSRIYPRRVNAHITYSYE